MDFEDIFNGLNSLLPGDLTMVRELKIKSTFDFDMIVDDPSNEWDDNEFASILEDNEHHTFHVHSEVIDETSVLVQVRDLF